MRSTNEEPRHHLASDEETGWWLNLIQKIWNFFLYIYISIETDDQYVPPHPPVGVPVWDWFLDIY